MCETDREKGMKQYRLRWTMRQPSEETEGMFMAEAPDLPGCRAWGETWARLTSTYGAWPLSSSPRTSTTATNFPRGYRL